MEYYIIGSMCLLLAILFITYFFSHLEGKRKLSEFALVLGTVLSCTFTVFIIIMFVVETEPYKQGQIDAINGKYKYERVIHYEIVDTCYYSPVDTIYININ